MGSRSHKSLKLNAILNTAQTIVSMLFPLVTFPYVSRILGVENIGKYNFGNTFISYFIMIAGLGINTYGVREGTRYRDDSDKIEIFAKEVFTINIYSTIISYFLLFGILLAAPQLSEYKEIVAILSVQILFITLGRSWIFVVYEEYLFVTLRTIGFYIFSALCLFLFIHNDQQLYGYCVINVVGNVGVNLSNIYYSRRFCPIKIGFRINLDHIKPILFIFGTSASILIYTSSDITILGLMTTDNNVGLYSASVKIYNIVKQMLAAMLTVTIPRFAYYIGNNEEKEYNKLFRDISNLLIIIVLPATVGLMCLSKEIILLISGEAYLEAAESLQILSLAIIFNLFAYMYGYCVLIPNKKERYFLLATVVSCIANVILNLILIPYFAQNAAALTTLIAELIAAIICYIYSRKLVKNVINIKNIVITIIGCIYIMIVCMFIREILTNVFWVIACSVILSVIGYVTIQILFGNQIFIEQVREKLVKFTKKEDNV